MPWPMYWWTTKAPTLVPASTGMWHPPGHALTESEELGAWARAWERGRARLEVEGCPVASAGSTSYTYDPPTRKLEKGLRTQIGGAARKRAAPRSSPVLDG